MRPEVFILSVPKSAKSFALCLTYLQCMALAGMAQTAPTVTQQPQSLTVTVGSDATFSVAVDGFPPLYYQWFFYPAFPESALLSGQATGALSGQTNSTLMIEAESSLNDGTYQVVVTNDYGSLTSSVATLNVQAKQPFAPVWKATTVPNLPWSCVASSADGTVLTAVAHGDYVYSSTNSGGEWISNNVPSAENLTSIAVSPNGLVWAVEEPFNDEGLFISTDAGATWQESTNIHDVFSVAFSPDGTHMLVEGFEFLYTSTNSGATWSKIPNGGDMEFVLSGNGTEILASAKGSLLLSTNAGTSWFSILTFGDSGFGTVTCSADGSRFTACGGASRIFLSTNTGGSWYSAGLNVQSWGALIDASSVDSSRLVAANQDGIGIYSSTDYGATWTSNSVPSGVYVKQMVFSQDGTRLAGIGAANGVVSIYTAQWPPNLLIQPSAGSIAISWPAPSTGFVLQQTVDATLTNWANVPVTPVVSNYYNFVTLPASSNATLFRLVGPSY